MFNILVERKRVQAMHVTPGDTIQVSYTDQLGVRHEAIGHSITEAASYNTLAIAKIEDELGFKDGLVGIIGNEQDA
jgi:hypothetical protein